MNILKLEPFSGISGDMFLAALAELADAETQIIQLPRILGLADEVEISFERVDRSTISCNKAIVDVKHAAHDHTHDHDHAHGHHHHHADGGGHAHQRNLTDILRIINGADLLTNRAKELARAIFTRLGEAEAACHGIPLEQVHFHEVGAVDSIIDIVGAAVLIAELGVTQTFCDPVCTGFGFVMTDHGRLPVPAPATERLLHGIPTFKGLTESEMTTPTGAAILQVLQPAFVTPRMIVHRSAWGAGDKNFGHPNALRASLCEIPASSTSSGNDGEVIIIQTNIDDMPGEQLGSVLQDRLLAAGALDVTLTPVQMKKGRPGIVLEVLSPPAKADALADLILEHTFTLGVRMFPAQRRILPREAGTVETPYGSVRVKIATLPSGRKRCIPEYEDCRKRADEHAIAVHEVYFAALRLPEANS
jgi:pyridinium-3,5-bisthiocarboxylic acid mononucleotide nickel chelatase